MNNILLTCLGAMNPIEWVGIVASIFVMVSMCFPTNTKKATILLRVFNLIGSIVFLVYGIMLPAIATAVLNGANTVVNAVQLVLILRKKPQEDKENPAVQESVPEQEQEKKEEE